MRCCLRGFEPGTSSSGVRCVTAQLSDLLRGVSGSVPFLAGWLPFDYATADAIPSLMDGAVLELYKAVTDPEVCYSEGYHPKPEGVGPCEGGGGRGYEAKGRGMPRIGGRSEWRIRPTAHNISNNGRTASRGQGKIKKPENSAGPLKPERAPANQQLPSVEHQLPGVCNSPPHVTRRGGGGGGPLWPQRTEP